MTEKDPISGVLQPITSRWDVPLGVLRGYSSESFAYSVTQSNLQRCGITCIYQLGEHDPSGVDAWRDFTGKVHAFLANEYELADAVPLTTIVTVRRGWERPRRDLFLADSEALELRPAPIRSGNPKRTNCCCS